MASPAQDAPGQQPMQQSYSQAMQYYDPTPEHVTSPPPAWNNMKTPSTAYPSLTAQQYPPPMAYGPPPPREQEGLEVKMEKEEHTIMGLRPATFFLSLALILVIIAAAVGGGVGGSMAVENARKQASQAAQVEAPVRTVTVTAGAVGGAATDPPSATGGKSSTSATATTTSSAASGGASALISVPTAGIVNMNCQSEPTQETIQLGSQQWAFNVSCGTDFNGAGIDIAGVISYSHRHCAQACASYNRNLGRDACVAVAYNADLALAVGHYGNCFLKNGTGTTNGGRDLRYQVGMKLVT